MNCNKDKNRHSSRCRPFDGDNRKLAVGMIVMSYYPELCGGAERQCKRLVSEILKRGHRVVLFTTRSLRETPSYHIDGNLEIIRVPKIELLLGRTIREKGKSKQNKDVEERRGINRRFKLLRARQVASKVVQYINIILFMVMSAVTLLKLRSKIDVWHFHVASLLSGWCGFWSDICGIPLICKGANLPVFPQEPVMLFRNWLIKRRAQLHFVALTEEMRQDLLAHGIPNDRISLIPNGVHSFQEGARPDPGTKGRVIYVANFTQPVANKAFDVLFSAWLRVHERRPSARLAVAGAGDTRVWREYLFKHKADLSVDFLGYVEEIHQLYLEALIMVLPSRCEGVSNALLEAQAAGVPAVVTDIPGSVLVVEHRLTGYVVPVDDTEALADAIIALLDDVELRVAMGDRAYKRISKEFSISSIADCYLALYSRICKPTSG
jgi:glycosyltransferase involved in cell wall biosynthesis